MLMLLPNTTNKPYRIMFEHRPTYLYVRVQAGATSLAVAKRYWIEVLSMQQRRRYDQVLLDKHVVGSLPTYDVVTLVSEIVRSRVHDVSFAVVDRNYEEERCGFEEMAGRSRGLSVKFCRSVREAEGWLASMAASRDPLAANA